MGSDQYIHRGDTMPETFVWDTCWYSTTCPYMAAGKDDDEVRELLELHCRTDHQEAA